MKCQNCGFETETNFCPMCGSKIENTAAENNNIGGAAAPTDFYAQEGGTNNAADVNPYAAQYSYPNSNGGSGANPYAQTAPVPPYQASANIPNNYPTPQGYSQATQNFTYPAQSSGKKTGTNAAAVIIGCIVGAVIIAGAVIMSISAAAGKSIDDISGSDYYYTDDLGYDYSETIIDYNEYSANEKVSAEFGTITLKGVEQIEAESASYPGCGIFEITFEVTNTLEEELQISSYDFSVYSDTDDMYSSAVDVQYNENSQILSSGETSELCLVYAIPNSADSIDIQYDYYDYDIDYNDYIYNFTAKIEHTEGSDK